MPVAHLSSRGQEHLLLRHQERVQQLAQLAPEIFEVPNVIFSFATSDGSACASGFSAISATAVVFHICCGSLVTVVFGPSQAKYSCDMGNRLGERWRDPRGSCSSGTGSWGDGSANLFDNNLSTRVDIRLAGKYHVPLPPQSCLCSRSLRHFIPVTSAILIHGQYTKPNDYIATYQRTVWKRSLLLVETHHAGKKAGHYNPQHFINQKKVA
jgi:hypothetical protein